MLSPKPLLAMVCILLAGCASPRSQSTTPEPAAAPVMQGPVTVIERLAATTDTLHFIEAPTLVATTPSKVQDVIVLLPALSDAAARAASSQQPYIAWTFVLPRDLSELRLNATLWVDVEGTVVGDPFPTANNCFWNAALQSHAAAAPSATGIEQPQAVTSTCSTEPMQVPSGIRAVQLQFPEANGPFTQGAEFDLQLSTNGILAPGASVALLTGSIGHDSQLTVTGLQAHVASSPTA